jgi:hypothetical protein
MSAVHELAVPRLHLTLRETRREAVRLRELAVELAAALDREVDATHGVRPRNVAQTAHALHSARQAGVLS